MRSIRAQRLLFFYHEESRENFDYPLRVHGKSLSQSHLSNQFLLFAAVYSSAGRSSILWYVGNAMQPQPTLISHMDGHASTPWSRDIDTTSIEPA